MIKLVGVVVASVALSGCLAGAAVSAAGSVATTAAKVVIKTGGAVAEEVVDVATPGDGKKDNKDDN